MIRIKNSLKSAFTLIELLVVLGIAAVLISLSIGGFNFMRDSIAVSNTTEGLRTAIRDAQDKALTYSVDSNYDNSLPPNWVYAYTLEYDGSGKYVLYTISDTIININSDSLASDFDTKLKTNMETLRNIWQNDTSSTVTKKCLQSSNPTSDNTVIDGATFSQCKKQKEYQLTSPVQSGSVCEFMFTTVNSKVSIRGGNTSNKCGIKFSEPFKSQTLCFVGAGVSDIKIYDGLITCP